MNDCTKKRQDEGSGGLIGEGGIPLKGGGVFYHKPETELLFLKLNELNENLLLLIDLVISIQKK